jgi:hypothetical protein
MSFDPELIFVSVLALGGTLSSAAGHASDQRSMDIVAANTAMLLRRSMIHLAPKKNSCYSTCKLYVPIYPAMCDLLHTALFSRRALGLNLQESRERYATIGRAVPLGELLRTILNFAKRFV